MRLPIRLDQFLKISGAVQTGGHAKLLITDGDVLVNNEVEQRRGRRLHGGESVTVGGETYGVPVADNAHPK